MKRSPESPKPDIKDTMPKENDQGFLNRWSQRKRDSSAEDDLQSDDQQLPAQTSAPEESDEASQQVLTDADMPDIETLDAESDYSPFLSEGVSKELRNLALKKLFFSGKFAIRDGLDDYDDDFTYFEPLGDTVTSDMKFHQRRKEKARLAEIEAKEREAEELAAAELEAAELEASEKEPESVAEDNASETQQAEQVEPDDELQQAENNHNATEQDKNLDEDVPTVG